MPTNAKSTTAQRAEVKRLAGEGVSLRQIAVLVFGDARYKGRVERILKQRNPDPRPLLAADDRTLEGVDLSRLSPTQQIRLLHRRRLAWLLQREDTTSTNELTKLVQVEQALTAMEQHEHAQRHKHQQRTKQRPRRPRHQPTAREPEHAQPDARETKTADQRRRQQFGLT